MLCGSLHNGISRYLIVENHCFPVIRITLGAYDSAFSLFVPLFEQLEQDFYFPFVSDRVEQKITRIVAANMLQRNIKKQPKICSVATRRKLFRGIMHALNPFILLSNVNGSIALKSVIISKHTS